MNKKYFNIIFISIWVLFVFNMEAQSSYWNKIQTKSSESYISGENNRSETVNYSLNIESFAKEIKNAPEFTSESFTIIELPIPEYGLQKFKVYQASILSPKLQKKYPRIQSYIAEGVENSLAIARISFTNLGVHAIINYDQHSIYIDPTPKQKEVYSVYKADLKTKADSHFQCLVESQTQNIDYSLLKTPYNATDGELKTYRLALACTRQYANYHLNRHGISDQANDYDKKEVVLAEMNVAMNRVNFIFERDIAVTMQLVDDNDDLIFLYASSDPYTNNDALEMLEENIQTINQKIGLQNYDIGHVFSTGGGGVAYMASVCANYKAGGVTGLTSPIADPFYIDYVSHEMGHQFGANHTFNSGAGNCGGRNRNNPTAVEPGSGSTIMGYAGICSPENVQIRSDAYFHNISIYEMWMTINGTGACGTSTFTGNNPPIVTTTDVHKIPISTPFMLEGEATDPDDDNLTYNWEQMDNQIATQPPRSINAEGPMFRSMEPNEKAKRYFPAMETILTGALQNDWEVLPEVERSMEFRLTVRDNVIGGGATESSPTTVIVKESAGPFRVTSQNTPTTWRIGAEEHITWNVANTDNSDIQCSEVDILLSLDGGKTFSLVLGQEVPNVGSFSFIVPDEEMLHARVMVKASNNIFFDVNDADITSTMGTEDYTKNDFVLYPNPSTGIYNLVLNPESIEEITISLYDINGKKVKEKMVSDEFSSVYQYQLDYQDLRSGVYFLEIINGEKTITQRLIKY